MCLVWYRCMVQISVAEPMRQAKPQSKNIDLLKLGKLSLRPAIKKALLSLGVKNSCALCGLDSWRGQKLSLVLDHIDGNATNNCMVNFRFLCPNCDSQSSFYKGRNKGRGRTVIGLRKSEKKLHT